MSTLYGDVETYCEVPLNHGVYKYAESCEVMVFSYALDDGPVSVWDRTESLDVPADLADALFDDDVLLTFHKSMFDRTVLNLSPNVTGALKQLIAAVAPTRYRCTMVKALSCSLPGALEKVGAILQIPQDKQKLKIGKQLIQLFCKPRPKNQKLRRATRETHPVEWAQFLEYAKFDIEAMRASDKKLPSWNYQGVELDLWHLDQRINDRGVAVDLDLAKAAITAVNRAKRTLAEQTQENTSGAVAAATQRDKLLTYILAEHGVELPDMRADTLERRLEDPSLSTTLRELIGIRLQSSMTSGSKYQRLVNAVSSDGRLRGLLQFNGASRTGRWAGRIFQPQNLPRVIVEAIAEWHGIKVEEVKTYHVIEYLDFGIAALKADAEDLVFGNVMALCSNLIRGCLIAPPGKKLVISDLANIEGRFAAWLAGEIWKLNAYRDYDTIIGIDDSGKPKRKGPDLYVVAYAKAFVIAYALVTKDLRQIGKVMELMLQYEGGVGAFITGAATYGIDLEAMAAAALPTIPADVREEAESFLQWKYKKHIERYNLDILVEDDATALERLQRAKEKERFGLTEEVFIACDSLKRLWRAAHPRIVQLWADLQDAARNAIQNPGNAYKVRALTFKRDGNWLRLQLPSGRYLCYPNPKVDEGGKITYMGQNQYTRQWQRIHTYGGKLLENATQAGSREVMAGNMAAIEEAGYAIVLTVHDEIPAEAPDSPEFNAEHLGAILARVPTWAPGLPLAAGGYETMRYRKD